MDRDQPDHAINKRLQLLRQPGRAEVGTPVSTDNHHSQVFHFGMELEKPKALSAEAMLEPRLGGFYVVVAELELLGLQGIWRKGGLPAVG
jgi:hypothetical protein